jgi:hypothetical protein
MSSIPLYVGHYGHPTFRIKHWSLHLLNKSPEALVYQITGSTTSYAYAPPEGQIEPEKTDSFLGKVKVGEVDSSRIEEFEKLLEDVPIIRGDTNWNCQDWIVAALKTLGKKDFDVRTPTKESLNEELHSTKVRPFVTFMLLFELIFLAAILRYRRRRSDFGWYRLGRKIHINLVPQGSFAHEGFHFSGVISIWAGR